MPLGDFYRIVGVDVSPCTRFPGEMTQTGGMSLAISFPGPRGFRFLMAYRDDTLSVDRRQDDGWSVCTYHEDFEGETLWDGSLM